MSTTLRKPEVQLGFSSSGVMSSRSVMLPELSQLLHAAQTFADTSQLQSLVVEQDVLHKPSAANRLKTFNFLRGLYGLSPSHALYREFYRLYLLSPTDFHLLAGTLAFAREPVLQDCADMVIGTEVGKSLGREDFENWIRHHLPGRYSESMYISFSHNLYASFYQLGFLGEASGKVRIRKRREVRPVAVAYAAFLDWLNGLNGMTLLEGKFMRTLELRKDESLSLISSAGQQGLLNVALAGGVLQLDFATWLQPGEQRLPIKDAL
jgi:hypothetical protein